MPSATRAGKAWNPGQGLPKMMTWNKNLFKQFQFAWFISIGLEFKTGRSLQSSYTLHGHQVTKRFSRAPCFTPIIPGTNMYPFGILPVGSAAPTRNKYSSSFICVSEFFYDCISAVGTPWLYQRSVIMLLSFSIYLGQTNLSEGSAQFRFSTWLTCTVVILGRILVTSNTVVFKTVKDWEGLTFITDSGSWILEIPCLSTNIPLNIPSFGASNLTWIASVRLPLTWLTRSLVIITLGMNLHLELNCSGISSRLLYLRLSSTNKSRSLDPLSIAGIWKSCNLAATLWL